MHAPDDPTLAHQVARGDRQAFLALYDRYAPRVYGLALRMLGQREAAEEITQDTFVKLWTRANTFNPNKGTLLSWLLAIARRTALDRIRLEARRPQAIDLAETEVNGSEPMVAESGSEEARWQSLRFALRDLPAEQREAIELAFYHGMSHSQMAKFLGLPLGTVKTRLRLGMIRLRQVWLTREEKSDRQPSVVTSIRKKSRHA
ncbi:MAG: sigma-70 family RNA polymerase sigma factor [Chloroflexota bacterium]